jgi:hypothetical protein
MAIKDREGNPWDLKDAVIRILIEKYPEFLSPEDVSLVIHAHPSFIKRAMKELRESNVLLVQRNKYQIKRGLEGGYAVGNVMQRAGEGIMDEGIFYFKSPAIKSLFIENHKSRFFQYPEIQ